MAQRTLVDRGHAIDGELAALRAALPTGHGQELFEMLVVLQKVVRRAEHAMLAAIAHLDRDGAFTDRGVRAAPAVADLLGCRETEARRLVELVMLCRTHHRMVHESDWEIRMRQGRPEFIPPKWLDPLQTPRRQPTPA